MDGGTIRGLNLFNVVSSGSSTSLLSDRIEFVVTEIKTNSNVSNSQGKNLIKLCGKSSDELFNGQKKLKNNLESSRNSIGNASVAVNGNKENVQRDDTVPTPKVQLYTGKIHVKWKQVYAIGAGLNNLGNTCFMNTVIQCLTYCPPLANYLLHDADHLSKCTIVGFCMMCLLQKHMKRAIGKSGDVIKPIDVYQRLKLIAKHFQHGRQEDAHEFLRYVIDNLWKSCLANYQGSTKLDPASKETTVINQIFGGYHRSQVICLKCREKSNTFDHFMDFILDIKQNVVSLEKALEKFVQPELLQQENSYKCPKCKVKVPAQKKFSVYKAPNVATFQFKRFDYHRAFGGKITKLIAYPEKLNLRPYMSENKGDPVWYTLNAVLVHSGASCNSGHYYCYVKNSNGFWYIMDDHRVQQVSLNQVLNQSAYVLFYVRMEPSEGISVKKCIESKSQFIKGGISEMGSKSFKPCMSSISNQSNSFGATAIPKLTNNSSLISRSPGENSKKNVLQSTSHSLKSENKYPEAIKRPHISEKKEESSNKGHPHSVSSLSQRNGPEVSKNVLQEKKSEKANACPRLLSFSQDDDDDNNDDDDDISEKNKNSSVSLKKKDIVNKAKSESNLSTASTSRGDRKKSFLELKNSSTISTETGHKSNKEMASVANNSSEIDKRLEREPSKGLVSTSERRDSKELLSKSQREDNQKNALISELNSNSSYIYGKPVASWDGEDHREVKQVAEKRKSSHDDYDDELDKGKVRKIKSKDKHHHFDRHNPFQKYQEERNYFHKFKDRRPWSRHRHNHHHHNHHFQKHMKFHKHRNDRKYNHSKYDR